MKRALFLTSAASAALTLNARPARAALITMRVGASLEDTVRPLLWGNAGGYFRKYGLTVEPQATSSGAATIAAVVGGALEAGHTSLLSAFSAHARGVPLKFVAPGWNYIKSDPRGGLLVAKDSPLKTGRDFNGKTFAASAIGDLKSLMIRAWVDQNGGDSTTIKFVEFPSSAEVAALQAGRVDGIVAFDPWIDMALDSGVAKQIGDASAAISVKYLVTCWVATTPFISANPEATNAFYHGMCDAATNANQHPAVVDPVLAPFLRQSLADVAKSKHLPLATKLDPADIQPVIDLAARYKAIPTAFPASELLPTELKL
jgi:NitT/TauT family transport system substrate-binding protein